MTDAPQFDLLACIAELTDPCSAGADGGAVGNQFAAATSSPAAAPRPYFWRDSEDAVVVEEQPRLAVYTNARGTIVIRQESPEGDDDDPFVRVRPENVEALVAALMAERDGKR